MNLKLKTGFCMVAVLFCVATAVQAQEKYLSQGDIDNFIENIDAITEDEFLNSFFQATENLLLPANEFIALLGEDEQTATDILKGYGMSSDYPIEAFYTIVLGLSVVSLETILEMMMQMVQTEEERQEFLEGLQEDPDFVMFAQVKSYIHPDDLNLIINNFDALSSLFMTPGFL